MSTQRLAHPWRGWWIIFCLTTSHRPARAWRPLRPYECLPYKQVARDCCAGGAWPSGVGAMAQLGAALCAWHWAPKCLACRQRGTEHTAGPRGAPHERGATTGIGTRLAGVAAARPAEGGCPTAGDANRSGTGPRGGQTTGRGAAVAATAAASAHLSASAGWRHHGRQAAESATQPTAAGTARQAGARAVANAKARGALGTSRLRVHALTICAMGYVHIPRIQG